MSSKKFEAAWDSLSQYNIPEWYQDAKFGIFIHWGVYSVPAFGNEWYPRNMYIQGTEEFKHHVATYGPHTQFGYKDFIPMFKGELFDPDDWAKLFKKAGAKFVVPVAEHHDGFPMYACSFTRWNADRMGPHRDIIEELSRAVRKQDMVFGVSSHRAEHWFFMNGGRDFPSDVQDPRFADFYGPAVSIETKDWNSTDWMPRPDARFLDDWLARTCELVDKYRPQIVWFDWWIQQTVFQPYLQKFAAYYYNRGKEWNKGVAINYKYEAYPEGSAVLDVERGQLKGIRSLFWQTDTAVAKNSWGYTLNQDYKAPTDLIGDLVDIVSKNGALLLNIGPRPDGSIPEEDQQILLEIGHWLDINGEAIYNTRPWKVFGEGPTEVVEGAFTDTKRQPYTNQDFRFTSLENTVYAICLARPSGEMFIQSLSTSAGAVQSVSLLGAKKATLGWTQTETGLQVRLPDPIPGDHAWAFKVELNQ